MGTQKTVLLVAAAFISGVLADNVAHAVRKAHNHTPQIAHIGVLVSDLDSSINEWRALGYSDVEVATIDTGYDRQYHGAPLHCALKQAFIKGQPDIELLQPMCDTPNPWSNELHESGMQLHHLAYYVPVIDVAVQQAKAAGVNELAEGKWKDNSPGFGEFVYVRKPGDAVILEYLSHSK